VIQPGRIRDTFVTAGSYIPSMKTTGIAAAALLLAAALTFGQSMMKSAAGAGGTGSMMQSNTVTAD